jgi:hypothetical protein
MMPKVTPPAGFTLDAEPAATVTPRLQPPEGFALDAGAAPPEKTAGLLARLADPSWLKPKLDIPAVAKGVAEFPQEAARQAEAHKGETLAQRARDPKDLQTAEQLAVIAGPASLKGPPVTQTMPRPAAVTARQAGYVLPPREISQKPGIVSQALAGYGGKIKTQQDAAVHNQEITTQLAKKALGLPPDAVLGTQTFNQLRAQAGAAYQAVANAIPVINADPAYDSAVAALGGANSHAAQLFPNIMKNQGINDMIAELQSVRQAPTEDALELVKTLRFEANANLHAIGEPRKHALGLAQREAADEIDNLIERNIGSANPGLVDQYRQARQLIAKSYDVEGVTNPGTGDVNAHGLAKLAAKGRPLTGELDTIANAAAAFPKATQAPEGFGYGEKVGVLDFFGATGMALAGHPEGVGFFLGRPLARMGALSGPVQRSAAKARPGLPKLPEESSRGVAAFTSEDRSLPQSVTDPYAAQLGAGP